MNAASAAGGATLRRRGGTSSRFPTLDSFDWALFWPEMTISMGCDQMTRNFASICCPEDSRQRNTDEGGRPGHAKLK